MELPAADYQQQFEVITEKICLCEGLCSSTYLKYGIERPRENNAVAICPGPNLAYFSRIYSLEELVKHIYGQVNLLDQIKRPHVFIKELELYIDYLQKDLQAHLKDLTEKKQKQLTKFKEQLLSGIIYYKQLWNEWPLPQFGIYDLALAETKLNNTLI
jgi:hypothetical protein